jgi:Reverse transcriptase (RNA-dependent DNA polymerase)
VPASTRSAAPSVCGRSTSDNHEETDGDNPYVVDNFSPDKTSHNLNSGILPNNFPNILLTNIRSISSKIDELETIIYSNHIDIAAITESWLNDSIPQELVEISNYKCYRRDRSDGRRAGGVCCYVRSELPYVRLCQLESPDVESIWLLYRAQRMPRNVSHIAIGIYYHPPDADNRRTVQHIIESADYITRAHPYSGIIVMGDFNNLPEAGILSYPLKQVVHRPTRKSKVLDKIFTNITEWYQQPGYLPPIGTSDHNCVVLLSNQDKIRKFSGCYRQMTVRSHDSNGKILLANALKNFNWIHLYRMNSCEDMLQYFYSVTLNLLDKYLPLYNIFCHVNDKPWVDASLRCLIRRRQYAWNVGNMIEYRQLRNKVQRTAKRLKHAYCSRAVHGVRKSNPRTWWRNVNRLTGQRKDHSLKNIADSNCNGDLLLLANKINTFLHSVSSDLQPLHADQCIPDTERLESDIDFTIEPYSVERRLSLIDVHKASGPDNIPNWFFRDFSIWLAEPLCAIFNESVRSGIVPSLWKQANVIPVPKVRPPVAIETDIRPISLTPTVSKILEYFVGQWILDFIVNQLDGRQYGCRKGRSTTHALVDILHHWHQALDENKYVRVLFIDYAKAFDHVDHTKFIAKLRHEYNVPTILVNWLCSFLSNRRQRVKIGDIVSEWVHVNGGLPQGSWLGPLIFIMFINDLKSDELLHKYVDDLTVSEIFNKAEVSNMHNVLSEINQWSARNFININVSKTKEMLLCSLNRAYIKPLTLNDIEIQSVPSFKLLGIHVDCNLKWNVHIDAVCSKANSRLYFVKHLKRCGVEFEDLLDFYYAVIRPVLEYACPAWHTCLTRELSDRLELVQKRALSIIFNMSVYENYFVFCSSNGIETLFDRRDKLCKSFFTKCVLNENSCLHCLLPTSKEKYIADKLRKRPIYNTVTATTARFMKSFIMYGLAKYL